MHCDECREFGIEARHWKLRWRLNKRRIAPIRRRHAASGSEFTREKTGDTDGAVRIAVRFHFEAVVHARREAACDKKRDVASLPGKTYPLLDLHYSNPLMSQ